MLQCRKLGLLSPEQQLPAHVQLAFQRMWANNGDTISQQYTGTPALKVRTLLLPAYSVAMATADCCAADRKIIVSLYRLQGDYTRTGERKLTGMMKDGVNSASRCAFILFQLFSPIFHIECFITLK
jgi:hypothetical protein